MISSTWRILITLTGALPMMSARSELGRARNNSKHGTGTMRAAMFLSRRDARLVRSTSGRRRRMETAQPSASAFRRHGHSGYVIWPSLVRQVLARQHDDAQGRLRVEGELPASTTSTASQGGTRRLGIIPSAARCSTGGGSDHPRPARWNRGS